MLYAYNRPPAAGRHFHTAVIQTAVPLRNLPDTVRGLFGQSGYCGSVPPTAAMGRSAVVALEVGSNDRLLIQATSGIDPQVPFDLRLRESQL